MKEMLIITDDNNIFWSSIADLKNCTSMDIYKIKEYFLSYGFSVLIKKYSELDLEMNFKDKYILFQDSEDNGSFYKSYIEDIIYYLEKKGARLIPKYEYAKAHHNKVYMEMMRLMFKDESLKTVKSNFYCVPIKKLNIHFKLPTVIKQAAGAGSKGVFLAKDSNELKKSTNLASRAIYYTGWGKMIKNIVKKIISLFINKYRETHFFTYRKYILQNFIEGLSGDYKVLKFGRKYYTLYRKNRENDFRASGSGLLFQVPESDNVSLLDFSRKLTFEIDSPILGIDVAFDGHAYHLLEFQMIQLGTYTLQVSNYWFEYINGKWVKFEGKSNLEEEFVRSVVEYINEYQIVNDG